MEKTIRREVTLVRQLTKRTGLYLVTEWRDDKRLGPCMIGHREVIAASEQDTLEA